MSLGIFIINKSLSIDSNQVQFALEDIFDMQSRFVVVGADGIKPVNFQKRDEIKTKESESFWEDPNPRREANVKGLRVNTMSECF